MYETHSIIVDWEYSPKFIFSYGGTSYCFLHDESFKKNNPCKWFRYEPFYSRYLWTITIEQINSEKHVYRSFEGYLIYRHKSGYLREIYGLA